MGTTMTAPRRKAASCGQCGGKRGKHLPGCTVAGCEYCGMQVGHLPECLEATPEEQGVTDRCEAAIGEARCTQQAGHETGEQPTPHRAKGEHDAELVWGYPDDEAFEALPAANETITTVVDGAQANVVLDGTSGARAQQELIQTPLEDRVRAIAGKRLELIDAELAKKRASERVKLVQGELNEMVDQLVAQVDGVQPLPLASAADEDEISEAPLSGAERRALAMTKQDELAPTQTRARAVETQPLSAQQPGLYVADDEGPEE